MRAAEPPSRLPAPKGRAAIIAGSCSEATRGQVAAAKAAGMPNFRGRCRSQSRRARSPAAGSPAGRENSRRDKPVLIYSSADPDTVRRVQDKLGRDEAGAMIERTLATAAKALVDAGLHPPDRCRWRDIRRRRQRPRRHRPRDRAGDRSGRTMDARRSGTIWCWRSSPATSARRTSSSRPGTGWHERATPSCARPICAAGASLFNRGLTHGSTGNISVALPDGGWLMTPTGSSLGTLDPARLSKLDASGQLIDGDAPTKEVFLHTTMYEKRPKSGAVVHLHSTHSVAVSCLDGIDHANCLPPITAYYVMRIGTLPLVPYYPPGDATLARGRRHARRQASRRPARQPRPGRCRFEPVGGAGRHRGARGDGASVSDAARREGPQSHSRAGR